MVCFAICNVCLLDCFIVLSISRSRENNVCLVFFVHMCSKKAIILLQSSPLLSILFSTKFRSQSHSFADIINVLLMFHIPLGDALIRAIDVEFDEAVRVICHYIQEPDQEVRSNPSPTFGIRSDKFQTVRQIREKRRCCAHEQNNNSGNTKHSVNTAMMLKGRVQD